MFEKRPNNQKIDFMYFSTPNKISSGETMKNGDSLKLKYKQYEIEVDGVTAISENKFLGTIDSIVDIEKGKEFNGLGEPNNIQLNEKIKFYEHNIFQCTRRS